MKKHLLFLKAFLVLLMLSALPIHAQIATSNLTGIVQDDQGNPLPGATVLAKNTETGLERNDISADSGIYRIPSLPFGTYDVTAQIQGFATQIQKGVRLDVGRTVNIDFNMRLSTKEETMEISSEAPLIEKTESHVGTVVTPEQVQNLPLNGRQFANLAALAPGTTLRFHPDPTKNTTVLAVSTNGGSGRNINFAVDGGDNNDDTVGGIIQFYSLESVAEFNFLQNRFKAEYGRSAGGVVNLVTKSGTNDFHGSFFSAFRRDSLNSLTTTEKNAGISDPSPFDRKQYGGSVGGPIVKDRAHFFLAIERLQQDREDVLDSGGIVPSLDGTTLAIPTRDTLITGKFTSNLDPRQYLTVRYGQQKTTNVYGTGPTYAPSARADNTNEYHSLLASHSFVISENRLNEFGFQYADFKNQIVSLSDDPTEIFPNGFSLGVNLNTPQLTEQKKYQFRDDFSWTMGGNHHFKTGVNYVHEPVLGGTFTTGVIPQFTHLGNSLDSPIATIAQQGGEFNTESPNNQFALYLQDDWNVNQKLTLNLGVRYDYVTGDTFELDQGANSLCAVLRALPQDFPWLREIKDGPANCQLSLDKNNVAPRLGLAYDWNGDGRTVFRGGYGLYYDFPYVNANILFPLAILGGYGTAYSHSDANGIRNADGTFFQIGDPLPPNQAVGFPPAPNEIASPNFVVPYTHQASAGVSRQIGENSALDVDYVHTAVRDQYLRFRINGLIAPGQFLLPGFGTGGGLSGVRYWFSGGFSNYDGVSVSYRGRAAKRIQFQTSYTLSRVTGNTLAGADEFRLVYNREAQGGCRDCVLDFKLGPKDDPRMEGPLDTDARHRVVVSGIFDLPYDIRLSGFFRARSALPFNALVVRDLDGDGFPYSITDEHVNFRRGEVNTQLDVRVSKIFNIKDVVRVEGILEVFNLFNAENPDRLRGDLDTPATFGTGRVFAGDSGQGEQRVAQLGFRIEF